jgi:hypothetical protein
MSLFARLLQRRKGYSVSLDKTRSTFLYRERDRRMQISGEAMPDGYAIYASSIREWETTPAIVIDDAERQRIASNIRQYYVDRGKNVYLS